MRCDMSINKEHVEARIREINDSVQMLQDLTARSFGALTIHEKLSMRYLLIQLVEAASSICIHILLSVFDERVEGFPECFARLSSKTILPEDLASRLSSAARLRNLLVHRYWVINDEETYKSVRRGLRDFELFVEYMRKFLERNRR